VNGLADMVTKISKIPLLYQPGTHWSYSVAVDIQGYIIEKLTGQKLGTFLREKIWQPLGMKDTGFQTPEGGASRLSSLYINFGSLIEATPQLSPLVQDFTKPPSMESGGGGLVSTTNDYAIFCQMMLNKGEYKGVRVLKPETVALMEQNQLESTVTPVASMGAEPNINGSTVGFGLDFAIALDPAKFNLPIGAGSIWWGGAAGTWFWIDPKNDLFFIGMIQRMGGGMTGTDNLAFSSQRLVYSALTDPAK
jgi:CubicO group peptidase (beta-lactamase class C family)